MARLRRTLAGAMAPALTALAIVGPLFFPGTTSSFFCSATAASTAADTSPLFSSDSLVSSLNRSEFISSVAKSSSPSLVLFHTGAACGDECNASARVIEGAALKLTSWGVSVAAVDVSIETKLAKEIGMPKALNVLLKVYHSEGVPNPYGGLPVRPEEFLHSVQDARGLQRKTLSAIPNLVTSVDVETGSSTLKEALGSGEEGYAAVLFTEAGKASPALRVVATEVKSLASAVQARLPKTVDGPNDADGADGGDGGDGDGGDGGTIYSDLLDGVIEIPGMLPHVPFLVLVDKASGKASVYEGDVDDGKAISAFIREGAATSSSSTSTSTSEKSSDPTTGGSPDDGNTDNGDNGQRTTDNGKGKKGFLGPLVLDPELLARLQEEGTEALVVAFVEGGDMSIIPGWEEATKGFQSQVRAGVFDCGAYPSGCEGTKQRSPHVRVYPHKRGIDGDKRSVPSVFSASEVEEAVSEAEASLPEIISVIPEGTGPQRTQEALQGFIGTSVMREGGPMVLVVLSKREEANLVVKTVSAEFQDVNIRTLFISSPDPEVVTTLGVPKVPAILLMFPSVEGMDIVDKHPPLGDGEQRIVTALYSAAQWGPVTHAHIRDFILSHLSTLDEPLFFKHLEDLANTADLNGEMLAPHIQKILDEHGPSGSAGRGSPSPGGDTITSSPFEGVAEATPETWASMMSGGKEGGGNGALPRTVGVFFLDRYSEGFGSALEAAENAAELATVRLGGEGSGGGGGFVWVDAPCQEGFAKTLGVSDASEVPVLVVFSPKHQKSARFVGAWEAERLSTFLGKAIGGRAPMFPMSSDGPIMLEAVDCSKRELPSWMAVGEGGGEEDEEDLGDFMAEILAEEEKAKRELEEEVARGLEELKNAGGGKGEGGGAPKRKTKKVIKRKKNKGSSSSAKSEL